MEDGEGPEGGSGGTDRSGSVGALVGELESARCALDAAAAAAGTVSAAVAVGRGPAGLGLAADREVLAVADLVEGLARRVAGLQVRLAGEVEARQIAERLGERSTVCLLRDRLRISAGDAKRRLDVAAAVTAGSSLTGQPIPPVCPQVAEALSGGLIGVDAAHVLAEKLSVIRDKATTAPPDVLGSRTPDQVAGQAEEYLLGQAAGFDPGFVAQCGARWVALLDPDGARPSETESRLEHGLWFGTARRNGLVPFKGAMTQAQQETLLTAAGPATSSRHTNGTDASCDTSSGGDTARDSGSDSDDRSASGGDGAATATPVGTPDGAPTAGEKSPRPAGYPAEDASTAANAADDAASGTMTATPGTSPSSAAAPAEDPAGADSRSYQRKLLDGLIGHCARALRTGAVHSGGTAASIMVTIDYDTLYAKTSGHGVLAHTGPVPVSTVRELACDANLIPVVLGGTGQILDVGATRRLFTPAQRRAIIARDHGCIMPGCTAPASWCATHHVHYHSHGGPTSTSNGALLCEHHHGVIHHGEWTITMRDGVPWVIPPAWIDPNRTPRRNHYHHPPPLE
ncbi:DUF222 domain-containing protein [Saxibacter everestensis]|uniref:DUF222 domain-containing protein n=1 Tax=Saxibacter everestensis TaxID=2909229 RepID=A0ABY8QVT2_9MICO|nr:DUF222 domain-containing protein [Brevibacteriaceae bacterium ZFBP1038]